MASEKQVAANRRNAQKSTGPKTPSGKLRSSMNSYRHGLSLPLPATPETAARAAVLAQALAENTGGGVTSADAAELAQAQLDIERVQGIRDELMAALDLDQVELRTLKRLASLDRWERYASTKRRRAGRKLQSAPAASQNDKGIFRNEPNSKL
jgi:hypothetical protein